MDRTKLFVAVVKTIRLRERGTASNLEKLKTKPSTLFLKEAHELVRCFFLYTLDFITSTLFTYNTFTGRKHVLVGRVYGRLWLCWLYYDLFSLNFKSL